MSLCIVSDRYRFISLLIANDAEKGLRVTFHRPGFDAFESEYSQVEAQKKAQYFSFAFLQEPVGRVLSALDASRNPNECPSDSRQDTLQDMEEFWRELRLVPQFDQLDNRPLDFYGSVEFFEDDIAELFERLAIDADPRVPDPTLVPRRAGNTDSWADPYGDVLPGPSLEKIRHHYVRDMELYQERVIRRFARSGRLLTAFQQATEPCDRTFAYRLGTRGFYAEIVTVARAMLYCVVHRMRLVIDSRGFAYRREHGWNDYFLPFCTDLALCPDTAVDVLCDSDVRGRGTVFDQLHQHQPETMAIGGVVVRGFQEILATFLLMIFRLNQGTAAEVAREIDECGLPLRYASMHIRRGDKVGDEDQHYPAAIYLDRLERNRASDLPLFVLSDDFAAVCEVREELRRRRSSVPVFSLCGDDDDSRGFDVHSLRRQERADASAATTAVGSNRDFREQIGPQTLRLLAETVVAAQSEWFVGTLRSNVGKSIRFLHEQPHRCVLLSGDELREWKAKGGNDATAVPRDMEIVRLGEERFFLFLDIFVHWSGRKITAVAPYYGDDIDWREHGVDLTNVVLSFGDHRIVGQYLPHRLDSWEPCILFDFDDPVIEENLRRGKSFAFAITAGPHRKQFVLDTDPAPGREVAMSVIVRDCNQWVGYFLDYYLTCLDCDHVYLYDNRTIDSDKLQDILRPYADDGKVTYIPWHYRWRNARDRKQIGQIPQQAHSLNKYGNCRWIGFFDCDEFLRLPGRTLKDFLADFDPEEVDGLSFGLRWFMYKGDLELAEVGNPLLSFQHAKPDALGRKRQKLIVSPRDVRFLRIHWLEDGKREEAVDDSEFFFHHYYLDPNRFRVGKDEADTVRDDYMLGFAEPLIRAERNRNAGQSSGQRPVAGCHSRSKPHSIEEWVAHIADAFEVARSEGSKLTDEILNLDGMCGRRNRHFLNAICAFEDCRYLEIGSYAGASISAAMFRNRVSAVAIDDWSLFGGPRDTFLAVTAPYRDAGDLQLIEKDCFKVDPTTIGPFDIFFYDGGHSVGSQRRALERFYQCLETRALVIIDDWNWQRVREGTYAAITALDMPVVYEKEIILPAADVVGMPRHRGRDTWWNGIYVMLIDKQATPLSKSKRVRAVSASAERPTDESLPIEVIVFSKDRACQLEALLRSMQQFFKYPHRTTVLYTATTGDYERGYDILKKERPSVAWRRESDFATDLRRLLNQASDRDSRHVMFLVDDIVFTRTFVGDDWIKLLDEDDDILALSLRLGDRITYCHPRQQATKPPEFLDGRRWAWRKAYPGYWNYPMSVDGNIYRLADIVDTLAKIEFRNPNTLEARMAGKPIDRPYLVCNTAPYLVNLALNLVQNVFNNPHGNVSADYLNQRFLDGDGIDIRQFAGSEHSACHIEPEISFVPRQTASLPGDRRTAIAEARSVGNGAASPEHRWQQQEIFPDRRRFVTARRDGDGLILAPKLKRLRVRLNRTGSAIWWLCDGDTSVATICDELRRQFADTSGAIVGEVEATLDQLERLGLATLRSLPRNPRGTQRIDLREIPFYVINRKGDSYKRESMRQQLSHLNLRFEFVEAVECEPLRAGIAISHLRIVNRRDIPTPFVVLEDDCVFDENFRYGFTVPAETDAYYLGVSQFGIKTPGELSWGRWRQVRWSRYGRNHLRVFNMLSRHAILYLSDRFRNAAQKAMVDALSHPGYMYPGDVGLASTHQSHLVLTPLAPICYQAKHLGGQQVATKFLLTDI